MEYYSAIKKNTFESVLMRYIKLEPIIQSEVSQKDQHQYSIRVFSNESALHIRWPKYWSFSFNISPSNKHPGLISFTTDWLDLLVVQGTLKSLLQHHSSKASIILSSSFFIVQLTSIHDYWKNHSYD